MNTIGEQWDSYRDTVIPKSAGAVQIEEARRAFYAGANATLGVMSRVSEADVSEMAGVHILEGLHDEMRRFIRTVT